MVEVIRLTTYKLMPWNEPIKDIGMFGTINRKSTPKISVWIHSLLVWYTVEQTTVTRTKLLIKQLQLRYRPVCTGKAKLFLLAFFITYNHYRCLKNTEALYKHKQFLHPSEIVELKGCLYLFWTFTKIYLSCCSIKRIIYNNALVDS